MNQQSIRDIMSGRRSGVGPSVLRSVLAAASVPYAGLTWLRRRLYRAGILPSRAAEAPVVCVGNLTTGGTGKSPMVAWVVNALQEMGHRPAILTRGYKADASGSDEAEMLRNVTAAMVIVDADRVAGAARAVSDGADVLVMDDGFQHLRLRRDLDIVLIDATNPFGYGWCLPRGMLREPRSALRRAGVVVITRSSRIEPSQLEELSATLERLAPEALLCWADHRPIAVVDEKGDHRDLSLLKGRAVYAFAGIAEPRQFFDSLSEQGARVVGSRALDDHCAYSEPLLRELSEAAVAAGASALVTTQKDFARLDDPALGLPLWQLAVEIDLFDNHDAFLARLQTAVEREAPAGNAERHSDGRSG